MPNEFLTSSKGDIVTLTLTNIDLDLFLENYMLEIYQKNYINYMNLKNH